MLKYSRWSVLMLAGVFVLPGTAKAEHIRFRYVPDGLCNVRQVPIGPEGAIGEKTTGIGLIPKPYREAFRPTHMVTFRHPYNARNVTVPITFAPGNLPAPDIRTDRIFYHHGHHKIEIRFIPDGSVDVIYNGSFVHLK